MAVSVHGQCTNARCEQSKSYSIIPDAREKPDQSSSSSETEVGQRIVPREVGHVISPSAKQSLTVAISADQPMSTLKS